MIKNFIKHITYNQSILLSYSGGLDSTVLLYQLIPFIHNHPFIKLRAIHFNHQIHEKSEIWSHHCQKICKKNNIPLIIKKLFFKNKNNFQYNARKLRYQNIIKHMLINEILVTAHHLNDQCETLFLSLKRGYGPYGLSGIKDSNILQSNKKVFRPLIQYKKNILKKWAIKHNLKWIEDDSNKKNIYDRNFIRNKILNPIEKKWPFFIHNCYKSMMFCYNQEISLNFFLDNILKKNTLYKDIINIKTIKIYFQEIQILFIKRWIFLNINKNISYQQIQEIYHNIINTKKKYITYIIQKKKHQIYKYKNKIYYVPIYPSLKNTIFYWNNHDKTLKLPYQLGQIQKTKYGILLPKPKKKDVVTIRFQTDKIIVINSHYKKKIKNIWQENNILPWYRNRIPIIFYNHKIIAILGIKTFPIINNKSNYHHYWNISWENKII